MRRLKAILEVLLATLREIFDENAYTRYLERTRTTASPQSYGAFLAERRAAEARRVRCC